MQWTNRRGTPRHMKNKVQVCETQTKIFVTIHTRTIKKNATYSIVKKVKINKIC